MLALNRLPDEDLHSIADFAELLCLVVPDRILSIDDLDDHLVDTCGKARGSLPLGDVYAHIQWRVAAFGDNYPFAIANNQQSFAVQDALNLRHKAYILLLLCANLPQLQRSHYKLLTDCFEKLAYSALKKIWPETAEVRLFGKNTTQYTGNKSERMHKLATDMGCRPTVDQSKFRVRDSGDGGIDLAAWHELDAYEPENKLSCLAQCACSREDWTSKQFEISNSRLRSLFNPTTPWLELICIPICFRDNAGRWAVQADVAETIVIDRPRILQLIRPDTDWDSAGAPPLLEDLLEYRREMV